MSEVSHWLVIQIHVPFKSSSAIEHADYLVRAKVPLDNLIEHLPGATHTARIVKSRGAEVCKPSKPRLVAAE